MLPLFITLRFFDVLDILLVAFLLYQLYRLIKGTVAINIFYGIIVVLFVWWLVRLLKMSLLSAILGSVIGVGAVALIIVFQQEIRKFLLLLGTQELFNRKTIFDRFINKNYSPVNTETLKAIVRACRYMSKKQTGALIVFTTRSELNLFAQTGDTINADVSHRLIEAIFFKNSPMHDGAAIIIGDNLKAARCVLPINDDLNLPPELGLRHRAALSMSAETDTLVITVSEENGKISYARQGTLTHDVTHEQLYDALNKEFVLSYTQKENEGQEKEVQGD
jgi:uncharacterized protein (TIGR00159 family)